MSADVTISPERSTVLVDGLTVTRRAFSFIERYSDRTTPATPLQAAACHAHPGGLLFGGQGGAHQAPFFWAGRSVCPKDRCCSGHTGRCDRRILRHQTSSTPLGEGNSMNRQMSEIGRWRAVSELYRRHPGRFKIIETHPCGGQADCLSLCEEKHPHLIADFNISGALYFLRGEQSVHEKWDDLFNDPKTALDNIGQQLGFPIVNKKPPSTPTTLVYRFIATSCSRFGRVELSISSHPAQAGLFSTRPGENPA